MNNCVFQGNLTRDPELKTIGSGTNVVNFGLAINSVRNGDDNEKKKEVVFLDMEAWGSAAETIAKYFKKGSGIVVECSVKSNDYSDADGKPRRGLRFRVNRFHFPLKANTRVPGEDDDTPPSNPTPENTDGDSDIPF